MPTYTVVCSRKIIDRKTIEVIADSPAEAKQLVRDGVLPVQWCDGSYLNDRNASSVCVITSKTRG